MKKDDLIAKVAEITGTKKSAKEAVDCVLASITEALEKGEQVPLVGFGTFKVVAKPARIGRNPRTGETLQIAAKKVPKFVAGKGLKDAVNN